MPYKEAASVICASCKKPFETLQRSPSRPQKFCSSRCSGDYRKQPPKERKCKRCNKTFLLNPRKSQRFQPVYCSRKCAKQAWGEENTHTLDVRFWRIVNKDGPVPSHQPHLGECWIWTSKCRSGPYGLLEGQLAHRFSWALHFGPIPDGLWVLHKCDNGLCVNPAHLFLGNAKDNTRDAMNKGRWKKPPLRRKKNE